MNGKQKIKNFKIFAIDLFEQENQYILRNGKKIWQQDHSLKLPSLLNSKKIIRPQWIGTEIIEE